MLLFVLYYFNIKCIAHTGIKINIMNFLWAKFIVIMICVTTNKYVNNKANIM